LIHPDWPFFRIFGDSPLTLAQDDRRLLYVALTRAVESLVVITESGAQSPFLEEMRSRRTMSSLPWQSFPAVADGASRRLLLVIKDATNRKFGAQTGTFPIKDLLQACRYQYQGVAKRWEKSVDQVLFDLASIQAESWTGVAMDVEANIYDESETLFASYRINRGKWSVEVDKWHLLKWPADMEIAPENFGGYRHPWP
jgi:DNA helicase-4